MPSEAGITNRPRHSPGIFVGSDYLIVLRPDIMRLLRSGSSPPEPQRLQVSAEAGAMQSSNYSNLTTDFFMYQCKEFSLIVVQEIYKNIILSLLEHVAYCLVYFPAFPRK